MLFSVTVDTWTLIGTMATLVFMATMEALGSAMIAEAPEELRDAERTRQRKARWGTHTGVPVLLAVTALAARANPDDGALHLFLYSVAMLSMPVALLPFRRRMCRHHFARLRSPGEKMTMDRLASVWLYAVLFVAVVGSTALLGIAGGTS
ncbi:hypothetical protein ACFQ7A_22320 [Streptomyces sp. NPDC056528]|uniref:hypothetical protein n=1 Tax=Streptomyces sp. NPDC056528 TaxID=3345854 RepID=UPI0036B31963